MKVDKTAIASAYYHEVLTKLKVVLVLTAGFEKLKASTSNIIVQTHDSMDRH